VYLCGNLYSREFDTPEEAEQDFKDTIEEMNTYWTGTATILEVVKRYRSIKTVEVK
jgi:hypothetical protein